MRPPQPPQLPPGYPQQPRQPPLSTAAGKATAVGVWVIVAWIVGPVLLVALCCGGCMALGFGGAIVGGVTGVATPTP